MSAHARTSLLIGEQNLTKLKNAKVALFGVGGVGGFCAEALVRSGVGSIAVFDGDVVAESNLNRQIIATVESLGKDKVEVIRNRLISINPNLNLRAQKIFYLPENANQIDLAEFDYVIDAIDTVTAKLELIMRAKKANVPVISCMGTGGKVQPAMLKVADIFSTRECPLARVMRSELKKRGVTDLKVVYSEERAIIDGAQVDNAEKRESGRTAPPSMIFVPSTAGLLIAREVVFDLIKCK